MMGVADMVGAYKPTYALGVRMFVRRLPLGNLELPGRRIPEVYTIVYILYDFIIFWDARWLKFFIHAYIVS